MTGITPFNPDVLSRKDKYQAFHKEVTELKDSLSSAKNQETVEKVINGLEAALDSASKDSCFQDIHGWTADVRGTVWAVRMHDRTRSDLIDILEQMLERVEAILADEAAKENIEKVRKFFLQCAENAEEISKLIDFSKILG